MYFVKEHQPFSSYICFHLDEKNLVDVFPLYFLTLEDSREITISREISNSQEIVTPCWSANCLDLLTISMPDPLLSTFYMGLPAPVLLHPSLWKLNIGHWPLMVELPLE